MKYVQSKITIKAPFSSVSVVDFEKVNVNWVKNFSRDKLWWNLFAKIVKAFSRRLFLQKRFIIDVESQIRLRVVSVSPANAKSAIMVEELSKQWKYQQKQRNYWVNNATITNRKVSKSFKTKSSKMVKLG